MLISEQLRNPADDVNWVFKCAVVAVGSLAPTIEDSDSGTGFAWFKLRRLVSLGWWRLERTLSYVELLGG